MVTRWTFFEINAITPLNFWNRNSSTNLITIFCEMVPSLRASWKIKIIKTKKFVAYFKVYSWGVYNLGIIKRNPHPHLPLPQPTPPTLYIIYAPTPTPTLVHYDVTFFDGEVWMLTSWTRLEHFTREICTYLDQEFVRIEVLLKKYVKLQLPLGPWCAEGGRWSVWGVPRSVMSAPG